MKTIKNYKDLKQYVRAFGNKKMNLLVILSKGGLGKTSMALDALSGLDPLFINGHITPLTMYQEVYLKSKDDINSLVVFDDVDSLLGNKLNVALLKQICDSRDSRDVKYMSSRITDKNSDLPPEFNTSCKVLMLMNKLKTKDENLTALLTRGHVVKFEPTTSEILNYMSGYAKDKEIFSYIKMFANQAQELNLRVYNMAEELKKSGLAWKGDTLINIGIDERVGIIHDLQEKFDNEPDRENWFESNGYGSRATYYRYKKIYKTQK